MVVEWGVFVSPGIKLIGWIRERFKTPDPVEILERRQKWKREFEEHLPARDKHGVHCEAILRDISRMDSYPDIDENAKGISPWFKVEVKGLYHRGIEVFTSMPKSVKPLVTGGWTFCHYDDSGAINAYPVGRIPFDQIDHVDWTGDGYYPSPHIFVRFKNGQPYETTVFYRKYSKEDDYMVEIEDFRPWDKKKRFWQR